MRLLTLMLFLSVLIFLPAKADCTFPDKEGGLALDKNSVFKLFVWNTERPNVPLEGTAFCIYSVGDSDNPTLYFLTAAHVILGENAGDDTKLDIVDRIEVRFGGAKGDVWEIDKKTIKIPRDWESDGRDFATFKVLAAGRRVRALKLVDTRPDDLQFSVIGFPQGFPSSLEVNGKLLSEAGQPIVQPWFVVEASLSPGMSGGPAISQEGVFAI